MRIVVIACPECAHKNRVSVDLNELHLYPIRVTTCDTDEGGCDAAFGYRLHLSVVPETYTLVAQSPAVQEREEPFPVTENKRKYYRRKTDGRGRHA